MQCQVRQRDLGAVAEDTALSNPAAILYGANDMRYEEHPLPADVAPKYVRIKIRALGICGSDVHFFKKVMNKVGPTSYKISQLEMP